MDEHKCLKKIAKRTKQLKLSDLTKKEYVTALKDVSFHDLAEELWLLYVYARYIKHVLMEVNNDRNGTKSVK